MQMLIQTAMPFAHTATKDFFFLIALVFVVVLLSLHDLTQNLFSYNTDQLVPVKAGVAFI